mmetsp:Transcript_76822/g.135400  ORF Transcript_76822/g.135400 Transcript_76822/m.135400 type:complete len:133 (-) Transcript_76822:42-440(-)
MGAQSSCCSTSDEHGDQKVLLSVAQVCRPDCECPEEPMLPAFDKPEEPADLVILFKLSDGSFRSMTFSKRPLGLDFNKTVPITMKRVKPNSPAEELGVQRGWEIHAINGISVTHMPFQDAFLMLKKASASIQ